MKINIAIYTKDKLRITDSATHVVQKLKTQSPLIKYNIPVITVATYIH